MCNKWALKGKALYDRLDENLAPYAVKNKYALEDNVRLYEQDFPQDDTRTPFQHDRDRIIHSRAFRRLRGKTQVFISAKGDHFRTRLSHTLEVSQISRSIARVFSLNEDLVEAIALGHDLGHTPFGHIGERTLNNILRGKTNIIDIDIRRDLGGFKHNYNSLNMVDFFEKTYNNFRGLNLTKWTREGIWKHTDLIYKDEPSVYDSILDLSLLHPEIGYCTFLEGQVVAIADEIAQVTHDLEDAFRAGIIDVKDKDLNSIPLFKNAIESTDTNGNSTFIELRSGLIRHLIKVLIDDVIQNAEKLIENLSFDPTVEPLGYLVFDFSSEKSGKKDQYKALKKVVYDYINHSFEVSRMDIKGKLYIEELFKAYYEDPKRLQDYVYERYSPGIGRKDLTDERIKSLRSDQKFIRVIAGEIAGMTDMFAIDEYRRLYMPDVTSITIV